MPVIIFLVVVLDIQGIHALFDNVDDAHPRIERGIRILEYKLEFGAHFRGTARAPTRPVPVRCNAHCPTVVGISCRMPLPTVVFPQPDSPTSASVLPTANLPVIRHPPL